ncbi:MAG: hypothetical protein EXS15_01150 [Phycisphaerales bacterium]|nr:hypothetical protein [Phycisphaerales bacterium]
MSIRLLVPAYDALLRPFAGGIGKGDRIVGDPYGLTDSASAVGRVMIATAALMTFFIRGDNLKGLIP